jgi:hypothetical protein
LPVIVAPLVVPGVEADAAVVPFPKVEVAHLEPHDLGHTPAVFVVQRDGQHEVRPSVAASGARRDVPPHRFVFVALEKARLGRRLGQPMAPHEVARDTEQPQLAPQREGTSEHFQLAVHTAAAGARRQPVGLVAFHVGRD